MTLILRWLGRVSGVVVALLFAAFWLHAPPHLPALGPRPRVQLALLVTSVVAVLIGWRQERLGGAISVLALIGFLILEGTALGRLPTMWPVYALMLPGLLLLAAARRAKGATAGSLLQP